MSLRKHRVSFFLFAVLVLHLVLTLRYVPLSIVLGRYPIVGLDYDTHYEQTLRALEAFRQSGRLWSYDPHLLAGMISGAIFDADNKLCELFVIALDGLGVPPARAFNLFILLAHLLLPPVVYGSARLFRLKPVAATTAVLLASLCWFFDALSHWMFYVGMISYVFAAYATMLPLALFHRYCEDRRPVHLCATAGVLAALHHLHPYSFFILCVPMTWLYARTARRFTRLQHVGVLGAVAFVIAANAWWLAVAMRFWHHVLDSAFFMDARLAYLVYDYLGFLKEPSTTGVIAARTGFRFLVLGAAALSLYSLRRERDGRFLAWATALGVLLAVTYLGGYSTILRQVQPYRFVVPAIFLATLPAAQWLCQAASELGALRTAGGLQRPLVWLLGLSVFVGVPRLLRDVIYFLPELVPRPAVPLPAPPPNINSSPSFGTIVWPEPFDFRHIDIGAGARGMIDFVREHDDGSGRWLVEWWALGERLAWATNAQILGGFRELNLEHSDANWFRQHPTGVSPDPNELAAYLERYNVKWVVLSNHFPELDQRTDLWTLEAMVYGTRMYRTHIRSGFVQGGPGRVRARLDRLVVRGTEGGELVLRYHYLDSLQCRPGCELFRAPVAGDRVGFIGVRNAPRDFEIFNPR